MALRAEGNISNLNTAIYLLQLSALQLPAAGPHLAKALITHFLYALSLQGILMAMAFDDWFIQQFESWEVDDPTDIMDLAVELLGDFYESVDSDALDHIVASCQASKAGSWESYSDLPDALLLRFHIHSKEDDLIDSLTGYDCLHEVVPSQYTGLCAALLARANGIFNPARCNWALQLIMKHRAHDVKALELYKTAIQAFQECRKSGIFTGLNTIVGQLDVAQFGLSRGQPQHPTFLNDLSAALCTRFEHEGNPQDIDQAVRYLREALNLRCVPSLQHSRRDWTLRNLGAALHSRFEKIGNPEDLDEAIAVHRETLDLRAAPHTDRGDSLTALASALQTRFHQRGDYQDLTEAVQLHQQALKLLPTSDPDRGTCLRNLWVALRNLFEQNGDVEFMNEGIDMIREALTIPSSYQQRSNTLNNLANTLRIRFEQTGISADIDEAIELNRTLLASRAAPNPSRGDSLANLAIALACRFDHKGNFRDIDEAIRLNREALDLRPTPHPEHVKSLNNLASVVSTRFKHAGVLEDLDEVIKLHRETLELWPPTHPDYAGYLGNLGSALLTRSGQREVLEDEAVGLYRRALELLPPSHVNRAATIGGLADALCVRFRHQKDSRDIIEAIQLMREVLELRPPAHASHGFALGKLGSALSLSFDRTGDLQDITESIQRYQEVVDTLDSDNPLYCGALNDLCGSLMQRMRHTDDWEGIQRVVDLELTALEFSLPPHTHRGYVLRNASEALVTAHQKRPNGSYVLQAFGFLQEASTYGPSPPLVRFRAACQWAQLPMQNISLSPLDAYRVAINLLPQLAALHLDVQSRRESLLKKECIELVSSASTYAIGPHRLRAPLDKLKVEPSGHHLATKLSKLATDLQTASFKDTSRNILRDTQSKLISLEAEEARCRRVNQEWDDTIKSIRDLPGHEGFMKPHDIQSLRNAALHGPVVLLIAEKKSSHALVIRVSKEVEHVPLPDVSLAWLHFHAALLRKLLGSSRIDMVAFIVSLRHRGESTVGLEARLFGAREAHATEDSDDVFRRLLSSLWISIVQPVFLRLGLKKSRSPSRLWWSPTGPFAFLPIHAAGIYGDLTSDCVLDYVVPSYTPTLTALLDPPTQTTASFKMMAVIQPDSRVAPLPGTRAELRKIQQRVPSQWLKAVGDNTEATVAGVLAILPQSSLAHFACHGIQDNINPLDSGLVLAGENLLKVSEIMRAWETEKKSTMSLAFLSACETAKGDDEVPDEAMHLAASFLFAGFRGVVATMWRMDDREGPKVADTFYEHLFRNCDANSSPPVHPDLTEAAHALHLAVTKLRKEPGISFARWVPFVHYGL
ncbi:CHAT domain-containing protein [Mycena maculata]|uniref:CHAT domain-containing protein n=1 Tax=Mycena maculata TaxID=230809 RepID=A0AAD7HW67_9AGAR|nr:CHAT domain-containing protein [Mycena maculata]